MNENHCKKYVKLVELHKSKPRITFFKTCKYLSAIRLVSRYFRYSFARSHMSDAIFALTAGQKTIAQRQKANEYHNDKNDISDSIVFMHMSHFYRPDRSIAI